MTRLEFLKIFFNVKGYNLKSALQSMITIQLEDPESSGAFKEVPNAIWLADNKYHTAINGKEEIVEGSTERPLFLMDDIITLPGDFHPFLDNTETRTTFGLFLFNVILFWEVFGDNVKYVNKEFTGNLIKKILSDVMVDDPEPGVELPPGKVGASQCMRFSEHCNFLEGLGTHFIKPAGVDALVADPRVTKFLKEQFELHKDRLNDPVIFTEILDKAVQMDLEIQLSGPSKTFYINKKFITNARKRMFLSFGIEPDTHGGWVALKDSLDTGVDTSKLVDYINTAVVGSYSRSMATGEGGSQVKETLRLIGRAIIAEEDCGSPKTEVIVIDKLNMSGWTGGFYLDKGKVIPITKDNVESLVGKSVNMRVPEYCLTKEGNYCRTCCGESLGAYGSRISAEVSGIPTASMLKRMSAAHVAGSVITYLNLDIAIKS